MGRASRAGVDNVNTGGAGGGHAAIGEADVAWFDRIMAANLRRVFPCLKHETKVVAAQGRGGAIVNTSSIGGMVGAAGNAIYAASKWGRRPDQVRGARLCPPEHPRERHRAGANAFGDVRPLDGRRGAARADGLQHPMNYIAHPADMARAALYLLTDEARWTTGAILPCEGGLAAD